MYNIIIIYGVQLIYDYTCLYYSKFLNLKYVNGVFLFFGGLVLKYLTNELSKFAFSWIICFGWIENTYQPISTLPKQIIQQNKYNIKLISIILWQNV